MTMRRTRSSWASLAIVVLLITLQDVSAFVLPRSSNSPLDIGAALAFSPQISHKRDPAHRLPASKKDDKTPTRLTDYSGYNDDAFGLVFLSSSLLDSTFAGTFLVLSAIAAATTQLELWNRDANPLVPSAVAVAALVLRPVVGLVIGTEQSLQLPPVEDIGLTAASVAWGLFNWQRQQQQSS